MNIEQLYNELNKNDLIHNSYEKLDLNDILKNETITSVKFPIYYLFDHTINENIGSTSEKRSYLRNILELDNLFSIESKNIYDVGIDGHSTILYKFEFNSKKYIYYSNSGLGINNQLYYDINKCTACKIFYIKNNDDLWNNLSNYIIIIINAVKNITTEDTKPIYDSKIKTEEIWKILLPQISSTINKAEYDTIVQFIIKNKEHKEQNLCYALLNFCCKKYEINISECSINHLIYGDDHELYKENIKNLYTSNDINIFLDNCYNNINENIYNQIIDIPVIVQKKEFEIYIENINLELNKLKESPTIKYKLENSFNLTYNNISGLYNNIQKSGSCTFYSYYNLALNMKILNVFNTTKNIKEVINTFKL